MREFPERRSKFLFMKATYTESGLLAGTAQGSWVAAASMLLLATLLAMIAAGLARDRWSVLSTTWAAAPGKVYGAHIRTLESTEVGEDDSYSIDFGYTYEVSGTRYPGSASQSYDTREDQARKDLEQFRDGTLVKIYYAVDEPATSRLDLSDHPEAPGLAGILLGLALMVLSLAASFFAQGCRRAFRTPLSGRQLWLLGLRGNRLRSPAFSQRFGMVGVASLVAGSLVLALTFLTGGPGVPVGTALWLGLTCALSLPLLQAYDRARWMEWRAQDGTLIVRSSLGEERLACSELGAEEGGLVCREHRFPLPDLGAAECQEIAVTLVRASG